MKQIANAMRLVLTQPALVAQLRPRFPQLDAQGTMELPLHNRSAKRTQEIWNDRQWTNPHQNSVAG